MTQKKIYPSTTYTMDFGVLGEIDVEVFYYYTPPQRGRYCGPPEDCYPDEPAELEIVDVAVPGMVLNHSLASTIIGVLERDDHFESMVIEEATQGIGDYDES